MHEFTLEEPGKYRIRVNLSNEEIKPRFSQTYKFQPVEQSTLSLEEYQYIELPSKNNLWMLDVILQKLNISGLIGNAFMYPHGYSGYIVYTEEEINDKYIPKEKLFNIAMDFISSMDDESFEQFSKQNKDLQSNQPLIYEFISSLHQKTE